MCRQNIRNSSENIISDVMSEVETLVSMIPNFWCSLEVAVAELHLCSVIMGNLWWKRTFFRCLLSLCYITNIWSYSSHLYRMLFRVARLAFLTPNLGNLAFFRGSWRQKILFGFFFSIFGFFGGSWHIPSDWCFGFLNVLLKIVIRLFQTVLSVLSQKLSGNP